MPPPIGVVSEPLIATAYSRTVQQAMFFLLRGDRERNLKYELSVT
ncbi:hypothetical protein [Scytonema sp. NUACC26]